jgi:hypothetical protein
MKADESEVIEGYLVDLACIRKYSASEMLKRAKEHTTRCSLMGHCIESGYAIVRDDGTVAPLDHHATPLVVQVATRSMRKQGLRLRVERRAVEGEMQTQAVDEA